MKEKIINELLEKSLGYLNNVEAFVNKELPLYVTELLHFKFWEHITTGLTDFIFIFTILVIISSLMGLHLYVEMKHKDNIQKFMKYYTVLSLSVLLLFSVSIAINDVRQAYKAKYAPRVYLVDYIKKQ